jgi:hypothetical protein
MPRDEFDPDGPTAGLVIVKRASAKYSGVCCLVDDHTIDKHASIVLVVPREQKGQPGAELGWACRSCQDRIVRGI